MKKANSDPERDPYYFFKNGTDIESKRVMKRTVIAALSIFLFCAGLSAQKKMLQEKHVSWRTYFEPSKTSLNEGFIVFEALIDSGYQMFAQYQMPQLPLGVDFKIQESRDFSLSGDIIAPKPEITYNHAYAMQVAVYKGRVEFRQKIIIKTSKEFKIDATVENEEASKTEEIIYQKDVLTVNVKPPRGVRLKFY